MQDTAKISTITPLAPEKPTLEFSDGYEKICLEFDSRYLYEHRQSRFTSNSNVWLMHDLSPLLTPRCTISPNLVKYFSVASLSTLATFVVWFSAVHLSMPLLAPAIGLVAAVFTGLGIIGLRKRLWICINDDDNIRVTQIRLSHKEDSIQSTTRRVFENKLSEAIEAAKQQEYYNFD